MVNEEGIEILVKKISPSRRAKKFQKLKPQIIEAYLRKEPEKQLKVSGRREKKFVKEIYYHLDQITKSALEKPCNFLGKHYLDVKDDPALMADVLLWYCTRFDDLEKKLLNITKTLGIDKKFLDEKYKKRKRVKGDYKILQSLGRNPLFYVFAIEEIIDKNNLL